MSVLCVSLNFRTGIFGRLTQQPENAPDPKGTYSVLADALLLRARNELARVRDLVDNGTLPRARLAEMEEQVADAEDQSTLARTLYGAAPVENMTAEQAQQMRRAAERRVARQQTLLDKQRLFLADGIVAQAEVDAAAAELASRQQVLALTGTRMRLLVELKRMAENERQAERLAQAGYGTLKDSLIRYPGSGSFDVGEVSALAARFQKKFGYTLPISAMGQTSVHTALGLDHRNRVDIALNPESAEGLWLRRLLEQLHVPYLAFRSAVLGAATAPHIHLGTGSAHLIVPKR